MREYEQRFANLPDDLRIISVLKTVVGGQNFATIDEAELAKLNCPGSCREYTLPRDDDISKAKGWIRGSTKIGPVLDGGNSQRPPRPLRNRDQDQLFIGRYISILVGICTGFNKYATEMSEGKRRKPERRKWSTRWETCC